MNEYKHAYHCERCDTIYVWRIHPHMLQARHEHPLKHIKKYPAALPDHRIRAIARSLIETLGEVCHEQHL